MAKKCRIRNATCRPRRWEGVEWEGLVASHKTVFPYVANHKLPVRFADTIGAVVGDGPEAKTVFDNTVRLHTVGVFLPIGPRVLFQPAIPVHQPPRSF